jgi:hypothetical protein
LGETPPFCVMKPSEMLQKFNQYYVEIEAIAQSEEWQKLCQTRENDPEMKTHLGDILLYLSEVMDCVDGCIEVRMNDYIRD